MTDPGAKSSVLIVEDDRSLRSAIATFLERLGYQVVQAENGEQALELLATHRLSALLCDIRMSGISGIDLLPRALASDPDLAIIMLTGVDEPSAAISCLKLGAADYLIKPVDLEELQHALQSALRKLGAAAAEAHLPLLDSAASAVAAHGVLAIALVTLLLLLPAALCLAVWRD